MTADKESRWAEVRKHLDACDSSCLLRATSRWACHEMTRVLCTWQCVDALISTHHWVAAVSRRGLRSTRAFHRMGLPCADRPALYAAFPPTTAAPVGMTFAAHHALGVWADAKRPQERST
jgi:hypothetical protein